MSLCATSQFRCFIKSVVHTGSQRGLSAKWHFITASLSIVVIDQVVLSLFCTPSCFTASPSLFEPEKSQVAYLVCLWSPFFDFFFFLFYQAVRSQFKLALGVIRTRQHAVQSLLLRERQLSAGEKQSSARAQYINCTLCNQTCFIL